MISATIAPPSPSASCRALRRRFPRVSHEPPHPSASSSSASSRSDATPEAGAAPPAAGALDQTSFTRLLAKVSSGDRADLDRLLEVVYDELRRLAQAHLRQERADHTLAATALVHEAYIRLVDQRQAAWQDRAHFFAAASRMIRRILVDHARARHALKRGGHRARVELASVDQAPGGGDVDILDLEDALRRLAEIDERQARIVELRYFGGLTVEQIAEVMDLGARTVDRDWRCARTWLFTALGPGGGAPPTGTASDRNA